MIPNPGKMLAALLLVSSFWVVSCSKGAGSQSDEAQIRSAIQTRLNSNSSLNMQAFDTEIKQVTIDRDHAQAQVDFHIKGGPGTMQLVYRLVKQGGSWTVLDSNGDGSDATHQSAEQTQGSAPVGAPGASHSLSDTLRSFRLGDSANPAPNLPPGHPPVAQTPTPPTQ